MEFGEILQPTRSEGLEILDQDSFGGTQFREHVRYLRGLQGEIEQMLNSYRGVAGSKVLLTLQHTALFEEDRALCQRMSKDICTSRVVRV